MAKTIYIAGLGLIGASMALGIKRDHPDYEILGYNRSQASRDIALKEGMIDRTTDDFASFAPWQISLFSACQSNKPLLSLRNWPTWT